MREAPIDYNKLDDKNWLKLQYIDQYRSTIDIGKECRCSPALVSKKLKEHGIKSRTTSESMLLIGDEISRRGKENWRDSNYRSKVATSISEVIQANPDIKKRMVDGSKDYWATSESREEIRKLWKDGLYENRPPPTAETRKKLSESTSRLWKDQAYRDNATKKISESVIRAIEDGRLEMTNSSTCGYYSSDKVGKLYLKSKWEFEIATALDASIFMWEYEFDRIPYEFDGKHAYLPDFKVIHGNDFVVIESKRSDWRKDDKQRAKIEAGRAKFGEKYILVDYKPKLTRLLRSIGENKWPL